MLETEAKSIGLTGIGFGQDEDAPGILFANESVACDFQSTVAGTIINNDDAQIAVIRRQRGSHRLFNYFFLVESGNENGNAWLVGIRDVRFSAQAIEDCKRANRQQSPGHKDVTHDEDPGDALDRRIEDPEAHEIQPCLPPFVGSNRRHNLSLGFAQQFMNRNDL